MKVIPCELITEIPKYPLMQMIDGTEEEAIAEYWRLLAREPKVAYLLNKIYYCVIEKEE